MSLERFRITGRYLGKRAWCAASAYGTPGNALPDGGAKITEYAGFFDLRRQPKPFFTQLIFQDGNDIQAAATHCRVAKAAGYEVGLIVGPDNLADADAYLPFVTAMMAALDDGDIDYVTIDNEPNIGSSDSPEDWAAISSEVYERWGDKKGAQVALGHYSSGAAAYEWARTELNACRARNITPALVIGHDYFVRPSIALREWDTPRYVQETVTPGLRYVNGETDLDFSTGDRHTFKGAAYAVLNSLEHAMRGVACCQFTLQNTAAGGSLGNGMFKFDGTPHESGVAMRDIVAPFLRHGLLQVTQRSQYGSVSVFANIAGELIAVNYPTEVDKTLRNWFSHALRGSRGAGYDEQEVIDYVVSGGQTAYPSSNTDIVDLTEFVKVGARAQADIEALDQTVRVRLPVRVSKSNILGTVDDGATPPSAILNGSGRELTITLPQFSAVWVSVG